MVGCDYLGLLEISDRTCEAGFLVAPRRRGEAPLQNGGVEVIGPVFGFDVGFALDRAPCKEHGSMAIKRSTTMISLAMMDG